MAKGQRMGRVNRSQNNKLRGTGHRRSGQMLHFGVEPLEDRRLLAAAAELVLDINDTTVRSGVHGAMEWNGVAYFQADDGISGVELWRSDGTASGTWQVADIAPGPEDSHAIPIGALSDSLIVRARDASGQEGLWKTDGTQAGTSLIKEINITKESYAVLNDELFFVAWDSATGVELWKTDGTTAGTVIVKDINQGASSAYANYNPWDLTVVDDELFFIAEDGVHGHELWKTDGSAAGTTLVKDIEAGSAGSLSPTLSGFIVINLPELTEHNGELYLTARDSAHGFELWKSNGTESGTQLVADVNPGVGDGVKSSYIGSSGYAALTAPEFAGTDTALFFTANDQAGVLGPAELWVTDGTQLGTMRVANGPDTDDGYHVTELTEFDGDLYFVVDQDTDPYTSTVWKTDGSGSTASQLHTVGYRPSLMSTESKLLISDVDRLYATDGTVSGIEVLTEGYTAFKTSIGDVLFFEGGDFEAGRELWISDGTVSGTQRVKDIASNRTYSSDPRELTVIGDTLFFTAITKEFGRELWASDGTTEGTYLVQDTEPGTDSGMGQNTNWLTAGPGDVLYFNNQGLWRSDGTDAGTYALSSSTISRTYHFENHLFFASTDALHGRELWISDGTVIGTHFLADLNPGPSNSSPNDFFEFDGSLYFLANGDLWTTDGTEVGTQIVLTDVEDPYVVDDRIFFSRNEASTGEELWVSDGTAGGSYLVKDIEPGAGNSSPKPIGAINGKYIFGARRPGVVNEVWVSDGTAGGTQRLISNSIIGDMIGVIDNQLVFNAKSGTWKTDGTVEGTELISSAISLNSATTLEHAGQTLIYFAATKFDALGPLQGIWRTDGTSAGTYLVDQVPVESGVALQAYAKNLTAFNDAIYYNRRDPATEFELFKFDPNGPNTAPVVEVAASEKVIRGLEQTISLTASDAYPDEVAGFTWHIDWDMDGTADEIFSGGAEVSVQHTFLDGDSPTFRVWAVDQESAVSDVVQTTVDIVAFDLIPDDVDPSLTNLVYSGTPGFDGVFFLPAGPNTVVIITTFENSAPIYDFDVVNGVTGRLIAHSHNSPAGDVLVAEFLGRDVELYGGDGADVLVGGMGNDTLIGGLGNDILLGGTAASDGGDLLQGGEGRDLLFGHLGADLLEGGNGEDLLVCDRISFADLPSAVFAIQAEWTSTRDYATRVANLSGTGTGPRSNGSTFLSPGVTVFDDDAPDTLTGHSDLDWYLYNFFEDLVTDPEPDEEETDLFGT